METMDRSISISLPQRLVSEETVNQITHGLGFAGSLYAAGVLMTTVLGRHDAWRTTGVVIYAASLVALYAASTLSHSFSHPELRSFFRMIDQVCIFLFITGAFTAFALVHLRHSNWWMLLTVMWGLTLVGIVMRVTKPDRSLSTAFFLLLGWIPVIIIPEVLRITGAGGLSLIIAGGLSYTIGTLFLTNDHRVPYFHGVWHVLVMIGSACHFVFNLHYVAT